MCCAGLRQGAKRGGPSSAAQLPKGMRSLATQTFALRGMPVYVPLTIPTLAVAMSCPGTVPRAFFGICLSQNANRNHSFQKFEKIALL